MKERGKDVEQMPERMPVILEKSEQKPNIRMTSGTLLTACREFFRSEENEAAFREWKAQRKGEKAG